MLDIVEKAREKYIEKYGVDPSNPKVDLVNGVPLPKGYVEELVMSGKISLKDSEAEPLSITSLKSTTTSTIGPQQRYGTIYAHIIEARDDWWGHKPDSSSWIDDTIAALERFEELTNNDVSFVRYWYWNSWDVSDVQPAYDSSKALEDLAADFDYIIPDDPDGTDVDSYNAIVFGWTDELGHNGIAYKNWYYAVGSESIL